jgi:predicted nucleotidyltransferase
LGSPVVYKESELRAALSAEIPNYFNSLKAIHHYRSMAERSLHLNLFEGQIAIKKLFYVLRPLFACRWIRQTATQPPTSFRELLNSDWVAISERLWITDLLERKAAMIEAETILIEPERVQALQSELGSYLDVSPARPRPLPAHQALDDVFRDWIYRI